MESQTVRCFGWAAIVVVGYQLLTKVLPWIYVNMIGPQFFGPKVDLRRMGEWAIVTGSTDGIGKSYAKALAKKGINLVLISRSLSKLEQVANEIREAYKVETKIIDVDFTEGPEIYTKIQKHILGLDVGILVNNVGISYPHPEYFLDYYKENPKFLRDIISANIHSLTHMCALVMPGMVDKKKGIVINLSSTAAVIPNPLLSLYSATKAFVDKFSDDLQIEYESKGIIIQSVQPGYVVTNMSKIRKPSIMAPTADTYVNSAINTIGISGQTAGYLPHTLLQMAIHTISYVVCEPFVKQLVFKNILGTRKRALSKKK